MSFKIASNLTRNYSVNRIQTCLRVFNLQKELDNKVIHNKELCIDDINSRIEKEFCYKTSKELSDEKLMIQYKLCPSVKKSVTKLNSVLSKHTNEKTTQKILEDYLTELIPAGTKGIIRGNKFNKIIEKFISNLELKKERFSVCFEKKCKEHFTSEIPDWYILDKSTNKIIIGMNQLDLWSGGHQINRGAKYILKNNSENIKLLCVVCNKIQLKSIKNKVFSLIKVGFENNTLCYLNNLQSIIYSYFNLK